MKLTLIPLLVAVLLASCAAVGVEFTEDQCRVLRQMGVKQSNQICRRWFPERKQATSFRSGDVRPGSGGSGSGGNNGGGSPPSRPDPPDPPSKPDPPSRPSGGDKGGSHPERGNPGRGRRE